MNKTLEQYLSYLEEAGVPALVGTTIAAVIGASSFTNAYTSYKERIRKEHVLKERDRKS
jgi:hypothetical protein